MTTAVVIPSYNGLDHLAANLPAVLKLRANEVIVVDDASTDSTADYLRINFPNVRLFRNSKNRRFPFTVNAGFRAVTADVVYLLNQDVFPHPDLIRTSIQSFANPRLFAVSFNEGKFGWANVRFNSGWLDYTSRSATRPHPSFWASGGSSAFSKSIWDELGGFDEVFTPGYHEDLDISWRARKHGYTILWLPQAKVDHVRETAFRAAFSPKYLTWIKERNLLLCQWKNLDPENLRRHFSAVISRCLRHPGFTIPFSFALLHLPHILSYRWHNSQDLLSDNEVFNYIKWQMSK